MAQEEFVEAGRTLDGGKLPIDLEHLSRYTAARPETTRELLILFRDQAETWLSRMSQTDDASQWKMAAHTLKGAARAVGAWPLAELSERAEDLAGGPPGQAARKEILEQLRVEVSRARRYIDQVIEPLAG